MKFMRSKEGVKMSKFDYCEFYGGYGTFAVNSQKYTKEEAIEIFEGETVNKLGDERKDYTIDTAWVRHRAGINEDHEPVVGWWLEYSQHTRSCPVWEFHPNWVDDKWLKQHAS